MRLYSHLRGNPHLGWFTAALLITLGTLVRLHQLRFSLAGSNDFRKAQTAFLARQFAEGGVNLESQIPIFGSAVGIPMEFPLFQILAAYATNLGLPETAAGMLVSLAFFQLSGVVLWLVAKLWFDTRTACIALLLFEFVPYSMEWGTAFLIESTALFFSLFMFYALARWTLGHSSVWLLTSAMAAVIAFPTKITTAPGWLAPIFILAVAELIRQRRLRISRLNLGLVIVGFAGLASGYAWTSYSDMIKLQHPITATLTSSALMEWNFGTFAQRLDPYIYVVFGARTFLEILGLLVFAAPLALIFMKSPTKKVRFGAVLGACLFGPLVFFNIYQHDYYFIAILPALALVGALTTVEITRWIGKRQTPSLILLASAVLVTLWTSFWGAQDIHSAFVSAPYPSYYRIVQNETQQDSQLLVVGCDWNSSLLYATDRTGLMLPDYYKDFKSLWEVEDPRDYDYLVTCEGRDRNSFPGLETLTLREISPNLLYEITN